MACIQEEGGNDCGGSRQEGMKEEDERSCRVRGKMKEEEEEEKSRGWEGGGGRRLIQTWLDSETPCTLFFKNQTSK